MNAIALAPIGGSGHDWRRAHTFVWITVATLCVLAQSAWAASKGYSAQRFDVALRVERGGDARVTEMVTFDFGSEPFTHVWREIPASHTDGIEVLRATMDDVVVSPGDGPGHYTVSGRSRVRIEWHFAPLSASTHSFGLTYVARGVAMSTSGGDLVAWRPLPTEHAYRIAESRITVEWPSTPTDSHLSEFRRIDVGPTIVPSDTSLIAHAGGIQPNGWLTLSLQFPPGNIATVRPQWQQRMEYQAAMAPRWAMAAGGLLLLCVGLVLTLRQPAAPSTAPVMDSAAFGVPEQVPPGVAAALISNGGAAPHGAMATLLDLAERGVIEIRELPRHFGMRSYELAQVPGAHDLASHEAAVLVTAFADRSEPVTLSKVRGRLARGGRRLVSAIADELRARGLLDETRAAAARRLKVVGLSLLLGGATLVIPAAVLLNQYGQWPLLVPLALVVGGLVGIIAGATTVVLSEQGIASAARWRGYRQLLKNIATDRAPRQSTLSADRSLVYAVALGLAPQWSRYLKRHASAVPGWFAAIAHDPSDAAASFSYFVATGGADAGGSAGAGAAGGGGSGAG
jgi:uncharacterized membrane protein HdeD (DUF308 family)